MTHNIVWRISFFTKWHKSFGAERSRTVHLNIYCEPAGSAQAFERIPIVNMVWAHLLVGVVLFGPYLCRLHVSWPRFLQKVQPNTNLWFQFVRAGRELSSPSCVACDQICLFDNMPAILRLGVCLHREYTPVIFSFWYLLCSSLLYRPYFIYHATANRPKVIKEKPDLSFGEVGKELGSRWRALSDKEKETWKNKPE